MNKVKIIADSTIDLSPDLIKEYQIELLPLAVNFGTEVYRDGVDIDQNQLYKKVSETKQLPKTSATSPDAFEKLFKKAIDEGYDVIFTGIGGLMSSQHQNALIACGELPKDRVFVLDSGNLSSGTGLLVLKCCKYRDEGKSAKEIIELVTPLVSKVSTKFAVESLDYLYKGGRCSGAASLAGKIFHVHPIIRVVDGKMIVASKPRGRMEKALDEMIVELENDLPNIDFDHVFVTDSGADKEIRSYLYEKVAALVGKDKVRVTSAGCIVSSHCGYGTIGVLYIKK